MANIERIDAGEAEAVWPLSIEAGWNQNVVDWKFMLGAGRGFGLRDASGVWEASSLVLPLGQKLAWISMVLVTKARRRAGLGTTLLKRCIEEVKSHGAVAGLDATEQGRPIYLPMGFHDLYRIPRWHLDRAPQAKIDAPKGTSLRAVGRADLLALADYDRRHSGMERAGLLTHLATRQPRMAWMAHKAGELAGFVLGREGRSASSIGPVVADSEAIALTLIARAAASVAPPFILDVPDKHSVIAAWLESAGAVSPRAYVRMTLGEAKTLDDPSHVFALAGPELG